MPDHKRSLDLSDNSPDSTRTKGHNYLLAIGIDHYQHCPRLHNAVRDARALVALLKDKYGFSGEQATVIELYDHEATRRNIQAQLQRLAERVTGNDHFILYFSGHGAYNTAFQEGYWIPVNAELGEYDDYLANAVVQKILAAVKSHHTFLIADSCFSGSMFTGTGRDASASLEREPSRWGLTSGRNEIVADGKAGEHSPFAHHLLALLRNSEKPLGVATLCAKMMEIVTANAKQTPRGEPLAIQGHRGGQYFFRPMDAEAAAWELAVHLHTSKLYTDFLQKYPESVHKNKALARLAALRVDADWSHANRQQTQAAYFDFIEKHPKDSRVATAKEWMRAMADDQKWREANAKGGLLDYNDYLTAYPQGRHADKARQKISALREQAPRQLQTSVPPIPPPPKREILQPKPKNPEPEPSSGAVEYAQRGVPADPKQSPLKHVYLPFLFFAFGMVLLAYVISKILSDGTNPKKDQPQTKKESPNLLPEGFQNRKSGLQMVEVKGGTFTMGSAATEEGRSKDERPHKVTVGDFKMGQYEVTQADWKAVMGNNPAYFNNEQSENCPVENVSWDEVQIFLKKLNAQIPGRNYRLSTEAEWEYAAKGGNKSKGYRYAGDNNLGLVAWYDGNSGNKTHPVGERKANELGLYDLSGNVWEWCNDSYGDYPTEAQTNPSGPEKGVYRIFRGGSWVSQSQRCRATTRYGYTSDYRARDLGFRLVSPLQ